MFFLALFNMYVYVLLYFNWPTQGQSDLQTDDEIEMRAKFEKDKPLDSEDGDPRNIKIEF